MAFEVGIYTFAELRGAPGAPPITAQQRLKNLMEEIALADQVGLDVFGVGEHHRPDFAVSRPAVVLGAGAITTTRIRLSSAVTVLGSDDPVRVFQEFATVDLLSNGRAEIMAGRGSFAESFPLFGIGMDEYDEVFSEKLDLLLALRDHETITWTGTHRPSIDGRGVYPRPVQNPIPVWLAVGGTPSSAVRAGTLGLPMALAIIGGLPERFAPFVGLYRESARRAGRDPRTLPLGINSHGMIADTTQDAADTFFPAYAAMMNAIGRERNWPPLGREAFDASREPRGANFVGSPQEVIDKILFQHEIFQHDRFLLQMSVGTLPHAKVMRSIELLGTVVAPAVRKAIG